MKALKIAIFMLGISSSYAFSQVEDEAQWETILKRINYQMLDVDWRQASPNDFQSSIEINTESVSLELGEFTIRLFKNPSSLQITHRGKKEKLLFESRDNQSFLRAGRGVADFDQYRGSFTIKDTKEENQCMHQKIDKIYKKDAQVIIEGELSGYRCLSNYVFKLERQSSKRLKFSFELENKSLNRSFLIYKSDPKEAFYGFGEQFTFDNLKGRTVPIFAQEQGHLRGLMPYTFFVNRISPGSAGSWFSTYTAIPQYISNRDRGLFLENYEFSLFDLTGANETAIRIFRNGLDGQLLAGDTPLELVEAFTEFTGRMKPLPDWMHKGAIVGLMGGSERVRMLYERLKTNRVPVSGLWIQDWVGKRDTGLGIRMWWNWELDKNAYPDWTAMTEEFASDDVRILGYINPYLSDASSKEGVEKNFFAIAKEKGYLTTWEDGSPAEIDSGGFTGTLIDLSNDQAKNWLKEELSESFKKLNFSGWMADFGEALPLNAKLKNAQADEFHNKYLEAWAELNESIASELGSETVFFSRNASIKSPGSARLFWAGDQMVTWDEHDGLKSSLNGILTGGFSGMSLNHSDIGGLISMRRKVLGFDINFTRDQELLLRWAEMNVFSPVYRNHEGNNPKKNHQFYSDHKTFKGFAYYARLFSLFFDYRKFLMKEAYEKGYPMMRHMYLHYPEDSQAIKFPYQFMFGEDFLVAPVTEASKLDWNVYLPKGDWVHLFSGENFDLSKGTVINVPAKLGEPPVFYRNGSAYGEEIRKKLSTIGPINFP